MLLHDGAASARNTDHTTNTGSAEAMVAPWFAARKPGHTLPQPLYTTRAAFDFDMTAIFGTSWLLIGFTCELPRPGSTLAEMVGPWPILLVHDKSGTIRGFHNSCRHRGSILCKPGQHQAPRLICPYHNWTYDLDGRLLAAPRMPEEFDKSDHGLRPIHVRCVSGLIFVCLADEAPEFDTFAAHLEDYIAPHALETGKLAAQSTLVEYANWKLVMENGRECYHCITRHPELAATFPVAMSRHFEGSNAAQTFADAMVEADLAATPIEGDWWQLARFGLNPGVETLSMDGKPLVKKPMLARDDTHVGSMRLAVDPHSFLHATTDHVFLFNAMPVGPTETHVHAKWIVRGDAVEGEDYDRDALMELWTITNGQDKELAENNQTGVNSPGYTPGPYSPDAEMLAQRFTDWYCDKAAEYLGRSGAAAA